MRGERLTARVTYAVVLLAVGLIMGLGASPSTATDTIFAKDRDLMGVATGFVFPSHDAKLWATLGYCKTARSVVTVQSNGKLKALATLPSRPTNLKCALDDIGYAAAGLYVTQGTNIYLVSFDGASVALVETIPSATCGSSVGILRDPFDLFGGDYLLICDGASGEVFRWNQSSDPTFVAAVGTPVSIGGDVALPTFGTLGRRLFVYAGATRQLYAVSPTGVTLVTTLPASLASGPGAVLVLHGKPYASITANAALFVVSTDGIRTVAPGVLVPAGDVLVATAAGQIVQVSPTPQGGVVVYSFHPNLRSGAAPSAPWRRLRSTWPPAIPTRRGTSGWTSTPRRPSTRRRRWISPRSPLASPVGSQPCPSASPTPRIATTTVWMISAATSGSPREASCRGSAISSGSCAAAP